jgi:CheY-like chemotaxis protein
MDFDCVLMVDDSEADNVFHEIMLRGAGFGGEILICETGVDGLDVLRRLPPASRALVLLDMNMPGMDGWDFLQAAQPLLQERPSAHLVMLTSSPMPEDRERAMAVDHVRGFVIKPLNLAKAKSVLQGRWDLD